MPGPKSGSLLPGRNAANVSEQRFHSVPPRDAECCWAQSYKNQAARSSDGLGNLSMVMEDGRPARRFSRIAHSGTHFSLHPGISSTTDCSGLVHFGDVLGQISRIAFVLHSRIQLEQQMSARACYSSLTPDGRGSPSSTISPWFQLAGWFPMQLGRTLPFGNP
jgi:hypothetical protein